MINKKWYTLILLALLGALILSACGGTGDVEQVEEAAQEVVEEAAQAVEEAVEEVAEEAVEEPAEEPVEEPVEEPTEEPAVEAPEVTITIWADENRIPVLESLMDTVGETVGVGLVLEQVALGDMADQVRIAIPAGEGPDIFIAPHDQIGSYIDGGLISPLDLGAKADNFVPSALTAFTYNSELYGLPYATENVAFFRNVDLVPEPVETWADVRTTCEQLIADGTIEVCTVFPNTNYHIFSIHTAFGGYIFGQDADGNYMPDDVGLDSPGFIASGDFIQQMVIDGLVPATADGQTADALFGEGEIPFVINGPWGLNGYRESGVNYSVDPIPAGDAGPGAPFLGVQGFVINALSENQLLAQALLTELIATDEIMQAIQDQDPRIPAWIPTLEAVDDVDLAGFGVITPYASPMPNIPEMGAVWGSWGDAVQVIMNNEQTPEEALSNGATQIRDTIAGE